MLLAIDIGNSNIVIGGIDEEKIRFEARIATDRIKTSDQYGVEIKNMLDLFRVPVEEVEDCIISSVVPPVFNAGSHRVVKVIGWTHRGGTGHQDRAEYPDGRPGLGGQRPHRDRGWPPFRSTSPPSSWWTWGRPPPWRWWTTEHLSGRLASSRGSECRRRLCPAGLPAAGHPAGQAQAGHREEYRGVYAQRDHVRCRRHAGPGCWTGWRRSWGNGPPWW